MAFGLAPALGLDLSECPQQGPFDVGPHHLTLHSEGKNRQEAHRPVFAALLHRSIQCTTFPFHCAQPEGTLLGNTAAQSCLSP